MTRFLTNKVQRMCTGATGQHDHTLSVLIAITLPLQGFFNFFIYVLPKYKNYRKTNPQASRCEVIKNVLIGQDTSTESGSDQTCESE